MKNVYWIMCDPVLNECGKHQLMLNQIKIQLRRLKTTIKLRRGKDGKKMRGGGGIGVD